MKEEGKLKPASCQGISLPWVTQVAVSVTLQNVNFISVLPLFVYSGGYVCRGTKDTKSGCFLESEILHFFSI